MSEDFFEKPEVPLGCLILVAGPEGVGKTHFSCTFPDPIVYLDTEGRAGRVIRKFPKKTIYYKHVTSWNDIRLAAKKLKKLDVQSLVIDSASDLRQWADKSWLAEQESQKVHPIHHWAFVNQMLDGFVEFLQEQGIWVVMTARVKREYVDDRFTGNMIPDIYHKLPYKVDLFLEYRDEAFRVVKSAFDKSHIGREFQWPTFDTIQKLIEG